MKIYIYIYTHFRQLHCFSRWAPEGALPTKNTRQHKQSLITIFIRLVLRPCIGKTWHILKIEIGFKTEIICSSESEN